MKKLRRPIIAVVLLNLIFLPIAGFLIFQPITPLWGKILASVAAVTIIYTVALITGYIALDTFIYIQAMGEW